MFNCLKYTVYKWTSAFCWKTFQLYLALMFSTIAIQCYKILPLEIMFSTWTKRRHFCFRSFSLEIRLVVFWNYSIFYFKPSIQLAEVDLLFWNLAKKINRKFLIVLPSVSWLDGLWCPLYKLCLPGTLVPTWRPLALLTL